MERWVGGRKEDGWKDAWVAEGLDGGKVGGGRIARWKEGHFHLSIRDIQYDYSKI